MEISKIISEALEYVVFTENYPRTSIDVYIEVLQANAGTRCAGLTAASVALADAGIPMRDLVPAVAVGKVNDQVVLDLNKEEDNFGQADLPIAMIPRTGEVILLQMDGHLTEAEFDQRPGDGRRRLQEDLRAAEGRLGAAGTRSRRRSMRRKRLPASRRQEA